MSAIFSENGSHLSYFTTDGTYGDADGMVMVDTIDWTNGMWDMIGDVEDSYRGYLAELFDSGATESEAMQIMESVYESDDPFLLAQHDLNKYREENQ